MVLSFPYLVFLYSFFCLSYLFRKDPFGERFTVHAILNPGRYEVVQLNIAPNMLINIIFQHDPHILEDIYILA